MIEVHNLKKCYGNNVVIDGFSYTFETSKSYAIIGKSGSGKTTLLNMLGLLESFNEGKVVIDGKENIRANSSLATKLRRSYISYLFQNYALSENDTIKENLEIACHYLKIKNKEEKMIEALDKVDLYYPLNTKICHLSGGEQQRIAIARLFLKKSKVILADEPTGNLDDVNAEAIFSLLLSLKNLDKCVIVVTHDKKLASHCDCIIQL